MIFLKTAEFKVGLLVLAVASLIGVMSMRVSEDPNYLGKSKQAWFQIDNAGGLIKNSQVRLAGIPMGIIKNISLQDGRARVDIVIKTDLILTTSSAVEIKSTGILGDKYVEIYPGNPNDPPLAEGGQILIVKDKGSLDNLIAQVGEISGSLSEVAETLKESVTEDGTRAHILGRIVSNIEKVTADLSQMTGENKEQIGEIVDQVGNITKTLDEVINDDQNGLKKNWNQAVARIDNSLKNIEEITGKVNRGEGTLGKLVNDETTVEELNTAIEGVSNLMDSANKIQTGIDFHSEYLGELGEVKSTVGLKIQPGPDRYYLIQIVDDPQGVKETIKRKTTGSTTEDYEQETTYDSKIKFNLLYAKTFYDLTIRGGIIENSGGLGLDYNFFRNKVKFSIEAFDFSNVNVRATVQYNFMKGLYVLAGYNDMANKSDRASSYLGAGLFLTNDDLKLLATKVPF